MTQAGIAVRLDEQVVARAAAVAKGTGNTLSCVLDLAAAAGLGDSHAAATLARLRDPAIRVTPHQLALMLTRAGLTSRVLAVRLGSWTTGQPTQEPNPLHRCGFGWRDEHMTDAEAAGSTLGFWRINPKHLPHTRHVLGYRLGRCVAVFAVDPDGWGTWDGRAYNAAAHLIRNEILVDPWSGATVGEPDNDDRAVFAAATGTVLAVPPPARNPVVWLVPPPARGRSFTG